MKVRVEKSQELKNLEVDRIDGVDKPATGRSFLLFKSEDGGQIMKGYGALATIAHEVLKHIRSDQSVENFARKSAVALNGLAQVMGEDPVFIGKSVPTQPYVFTEPDTDKRGPADEDLGPNFTPRSMPGSMVGSVQFRIKDEDDSKVKAAAKDNDDNDEDDKKAKAMKAARAAFAKAMYDEDDKKSNDKQKDKGDHKEPDADDMDASERANRGVMRSMEMLTKAVLAQSELIAKASGFELVSKAEDPDAIETIRPRPKSRQVIEEVQKSADGRVSFANVIFDQQMGRR